MSEVCVSPNLAGRAAEKIRSEIAFRTLKPGDIIGKEHELADRLEISRITLREAIGQLRGLGLVESRQRVGLVVAQPDPAALFGRAIPQYVVDHATFTELAHLRCYLELGCIEAAVAKATESDIERLRSLALDFCKIVATDLERRRELDSEFHEALISAAGNALLEDMHGVITAFFHRGRWEHPDFFSRGAEVVSREHVELSEAFAARDGRRARDVLATHLQSYASPAERMKAKG